MKNIIYVDYDEKYFEQAKEIIIDQYLCQKFKMNYLPEIDSVYIGLIDQLKFFSENGKGLCALSNDRLIGFVLGFPREKMLGLAKSVYIPPIGHGVISNYPDKLKLYEQLIVKSLEFFKEMDLTSFAITVFEHNLKLRNFLYHLGFGLRNIDAINKVSSLPTDTKNLDIRKINDMNFLKELHKKHNEYYRKSPIFLPNEDEDPVKDLISWKSQRNRNIWGVFDKSQVVGYMRTQEEGENFISNSKEVINITGAFIEAKKRGKGLGHNLLSEIIRHSIFNDYRLCGVDFESSNVLGSNFWMKYFSPYTYTLARRIDERILNY